jgi:hypothetical protein
MGEIALARLWHFPAGATCLLLKDPVSDTWEVRVVRDDRVVRSGQFNSALAAMEEARQWRTSFDPALQPFQ